MSNQPIPPKPSTPEQPSGKGLDATTCSRSFLEMRWYDKQWKKWTEWEEVEGFKLREKYGTTPEEWKASCKAWIEVGGHYEYRIGTRTDVIEWEISYRENATDERRLDETACSPCLSVDTAPKGKIIDLWDRDRKRHTDCAWDEKNHRWMRGVPETGVCYEIKNPTHWSPIPIVPALRTN